MKQLKVCLSLLPLMLLAVVTPSQGQTTCVQPSTKYLGTTPPPAYWQSSAPPQTSYECMDVIFQNRLVMLGGQQKLMSVIGCDVAFFDVSGSSPVLESSTKLWNFGNNYSHNVHYVSGVETLEGFPYVMHSMANNGWLLGKIVMGGSGNVSRLDYVTHFKLANKPGDDVQVYGSKMWWGLDGRVYAVGMYLDKNPDSAVFQIADLGTGASTPTVTKKSTLPTTSSSSVFHTVKVGNKIYLLQWGRYGLYVFDVTNPSSPVEVAFHQDAGLRFLVGKDYGPDHNWGPVLLNRGSEASPQWRAYSYLRNGRNLYIWDFNNPLAPSLLDQTTVPDGTNAILSIASDGQLLVAHRAANPNGLAVPQITYYSVGDDSFSEIPSEFWHSGNRDRWFEEEPHEIALVAGATQYKVYAASRIRAYQSTVQTSCLSFTPTAAVGITRSGGQGTPTCQAQHGEAVKGFPGDSFNLQNQSTSGLTLESLEVSGPNQYYQNLTGSFGGGSLLWQSPNSGGSVGEYTFTIKVRDGQQQQFTGYAYVQLCGNPTVRLAVTHTRAPGGNWAACTQCSWLAGYGVRLTARQSDGNPYWNASNPAWAVELCTPAAGCSAAPAEHWSNNQDGTLDLTLSVTGDYKVSGDVSYPFLEIPLPTGQTTIHSGAVTASFNATQGSTPIASNGTASRTAAITLTFTGQVAPENTATCAWSISPAHWGPVQQNCFASAPVIPAGTLQANQQYTLNLVASSSPIQDQALAQLTFTATELTGDFSWSPTSGIGIGTTVTFTPQNLPTDVKKLRWQFGEEGCDPVSHPATYDDPCLMGCNNSFKPFQFKTSGTKTVVLSASTDQVNYTQIASRSLSVGSSGSCVTCTAPSAPNNSSPANGSTVGSTSVQFSWTPSQGTSPISYTVSASSMMGSGGCNSSSTSCTATLSAGTYNWRVTASNSCGSAQSSTFSLTVGSSGTAPSTPMLVSPAAGATVPGGPVTFSWNASAGTTPITYEVLLGGTIKICSNLSSPTCTTNINTSGTYTWAVKAINSVGSTTSESRTLIVGTPCVAPAAPTNPTPASGGVASPGTVTLRWSAPASGTTPFTYDVYLGAVKACSDATAAQCVVNNLQSGSFSWYVKAKNACSTAGVQSATWTFSICNASAVPVADFTWSPREAITVGGVVQEQPYVGQSVTFDPALTTNYPTSFQWYDFHENPGANYTVANPQHTWSTPGAKNVRLRATNCIGVSAETRKEVVVHADVRPVTASFTSTVSNPQRPQEVTFAALKGVDQGEPNHFAWDFGDGTTVAGSDKGTYVHTFKCGATYPVKLTAKRVKSGSTITSQPLTQQVRVGGDSCSPQSLLVVDVARNLPGKNNALWSTELTIYNPTSDEMMLKLAVKRADGSAREESRTFSLMPYETLSLEQILAYVQIDFSKASVWFYQADPINRGMKPLPVISARTHTGTVPPYDDFGQFVMVNPVFQASTKKQTLYLTGLRHNGKTAQDLGQGFRTNLTIVEPAGGGWNGSAVKLTLLKVDDPAFVKERQLWASAAYGYWQRSIESYFSDLSPEDDLGRIILRIEVEAGASIAFGCSLVNNFTNAPIFVPTQELP